MQVDPGLYVPREACDPQLLVVKSTVVWHWHTRANHFRNYSCTISMMIHLILLEILLGERLYNLSARSL